MAGTDLLPQPVRSALTHCNAISEMREALLSCPENTAWLVASGPLTNVALLFATFPEVAHHIKGLSIMGGAVGHGFTSVSMGPPYMDGDGKLHPRSGNRTPFAEFNIWCDPESAQSVLRNPVLHDKTVLIPLDLTHQAYATSKIQGMLLHGEQGPSRLRRMFNELLMFFAHTYAEVFHLTEGPPLHDPLAVAVLLSRHEDPAVSIDFSDHGGERWDVNVVLEGEQIGRTVIAPAKHGVIIPRSLDLDTFWTVLEQCMARADEATGYKP